MAVKNIDLSELEKLQGAIEAAPERTMQALAQAMSQSVQLVARQATIYPPATDANQPGRTYPDGRPKGYYERGRGWWYPLVTERTLGKQRMLKTHGLIKPPKKLRGTVVAYRLSQSNHSEQLSQQWNTEVRREEGALIGVIGNRASYAGHVKGFRDHDPYQAQHMADIGWTDLMSDYEAVKSAILDAFSKAIDELVRGLVG